MIFTRFEEPDINEINKMLSEPPPWQGTHESIWEVNSKYLTELKNRRSTLIIEESW